MGITVVYVTHDQSEAMTMSDRIFLLNSGEVQQSGPPAEIYTHPVNPFVADFLGKVSFYRGRAEKGKIRLTDWECELPGDGKTPEGPVTVGIRPENIRIRKGEDGIFGTVERMYYMGDSTDFRVRVGKASVRVISDGFSHRDFRPGDAVRLEILEKMVFAGDNLQEQLKIRT